MQSEKSNKSLFRLSPAINQLKDGSNILESSSKFYLLHFIFGEKFYFNYITKDNRKLKTMPY